MLLSKSTNLPFAWGLCYLLQRILDATFRWSCVVDTHSMQLKHNLNTKQNTIHTPNTIPVETKQNQYATGRSVILPILLLE